MGDGKMNNSGDPVNPPNQQQGDSSSNEGDEDFEDAEFINEDEVEEVEVLEEEADPADQMVEEMDDMELQEEEPAPTQDDSRLVFDKHTGAVFCIRSDRSDQGLAISGGQDDRAFVWNINTGQVAFECKGHKDSVSYVGFSHNSEMVFTADMSGLIKVWEVKNGKEIWNFDVGDLEWAEWHPLAPVLLAGTSDGSSWMWKIPDGACKTFPGEAEACCVGRCMPDGKRVCLGYANGIVKIVDLKSGATIHNFTGHDAHSSSITSMDVHPDNNLLITGSTDCTARLYNTTSGKTICAFNCGDANSEVESENSVETVAFSKSLNAVCTGSLNGKLTIWDLSTQRERQQFTHQAGIVRSIWDDAGMLYTCTLDGTAQAWDSRSGKQERHWHGHKLEVLDLDVCKQQNAVLTASEDATVRVFSLN